MATDKKTIEAMRRLADKLEDLGVKNKDLTTLRYHIARQEKQIGWEFKNGKWVYHPYLK